jgi:membrane protein implicated in regulation of membrane protease activity
MLVVGGQIGWFDGSKTEGGVVTPFRRCRAVIGLRSPRWLMAENGGERIGSMTERRKLLLFAGRMLVLAVAGTLGILALIFVPGMVIEYDVGSATISAKDRLAAISSMRNMILQVFGGLVIFFGAYVTWRRLAVSEAQLLATRDTQVTDRYAKAIEQLGNLNLDVRLGGSILWKGLLGTQLLTWGR